MKIIFECFGFIKEVYYVEQTPTELIEKDFKVIRLWETDIKNDPSIVLRSISPYIYS